MVAIRYVAAAILFILLILIVAPALASTYNTHITSGAYGKVYGDVSFITWGNYTRNVTVHSGDLSYDYNYTAKEGNITTVEMYITSGDHLNYSYTLSNGDVISGYINDVNMDSLFSWYSNMYLNMNGLTDVYQQGDAIPFLIHQADLVRLGYLFDHKTNQTMVGLTVTHGPSINLPDKHMGITSFTAHSDRTITYSIEEFSAKDYYNNLPFG